MSLLQDKKECYLCRKKADMVGWQGDLPPVPLHKHHIFGGVANRKKSDEHLTVYLCVEHHLTGKEAVHRNREVMLMLRREGQKEYEEKFSHEKFMNEFGRNYL